MAMPRAHSAESTVSSRKCQRVVSKVMRMATATPAASPPPQGVSQGRRLSRAGKSPWR